jgi:hypothetical protein
MRGKCLTSYMFAPGYLDVLLKPGPFIIVAGGGGPMGPPRPPRPRPRPRPRPGMPPGMAKSGFAALASRMASSCLMGRRGMGPPGPL